MLIFYFFAAVLILQGISSLRGGYRFLDYVRGELARPPSGFAPPASIIAPFRGIDDGFRENVAALFNQEYSPYEIVFVTDAASDPALGIIEEACRAFAGRRGVSAHIVVAGPALVSGQKVHNLLAALDRVSARSEVLVFADTDARPGDAWLGSLVAPLADESIGAATGYRWFIPARGGAASKLRAVWNASIASALGARGDRNFCWGGATAIRREVFERLRIAERWHGTLSDDFTMTRALHDARLPIHFVPRCLTASPGDCGFRELFEFTTRQMKITRVYAPHLWKAVLVGGILFCSVFYGGIVLVAVRAWLGLGYALALVFLGIVFALGVAKARVRLHAVGLAMPAYHVELGRDAGAHLALWPVASLLFLINALCAAFSRRIEWRGITYVLKSPVETAIIPPNPHKIEKEGVNAGS